MTHSERSEEVRDLRAAIVPAALLLGLLLVAGTSLLAAVNHQPFGDYSRDLQALATDAGAVLPPLAGGLALLNLMVWPSVASMAVLAAVLWPPRRQWLLAFAFLNILLALDDALLLHDGVGPRLGIPEAAFFLLYAAMGIRLLLGAFPLAAGAQPEDRLSRFRVQNLSSGGRAFILGLLLLGVSVVVDQTVHGQPVWEDGPKLLGALVWLTVPWLELPSNVLSHFRSMDEQVVRADRAQRR